jgi:hypothetical protein
MTPWLWNSGFGVDLREPTINLASMDTTRPKIIFGVVSERYLLYISPPEHTATDGKGIDDSLAIELRIVWVSKQVTSSNQQPGSRMAGSQSENNIWYVGRALPSLY